VAALCAVAPAFAVAQPPNAPARSNVAQARPAAAPTQAQAPRRPGGGVNDFGGANNNKPFNIEADKLEVFQKEGRAVYSGKVVAVQGETTMKCSQLVVFFDQSKAGQPGAAAPAASAAPGQSGATDALKKLECKGPVSVVAKQDGKTQVATGNNAIYDRAAGFVTLSGNVNMSQEGNVSTCETFTYNTNSGVANCVPIPGGRVRGVFEPGADNKPAAKPKP
jgi:lipopolysaccharide export system protein LptA